MLNRLKDVFASFQKHDVRYAVIGGVAATLYGVPRATLTTEKELLKYQSQPFYVASKSDLIASKRAASRDIDLEDIKLLELPENPEDDE